MKTTPTTMSVNISFSKKALEKINSENNMYNLHEMLSYKLLNLFNTIINSPNTIGVFRAQLDTKLVSYDIVDINEDNFEHETRRLLRFITSLKNHL